MSGSGISWKLNICKSAPRSRQITTPAPTTQCLQAGCPPCRPTNSVKALKAYKHTDTISIILRPHPYRQRSKKNACFYFTCQVLSLAGQNRFATVTDRPISPHANAASTFPREAPESGNIPNNLIAIQVLIRQSLVNRVVCIYKGSPYSITERRVPELIPVLGSQPAGDVSHKPDGRLPLLSARPACSYPRNP